MYRRPVLTAIYPVGKANRTVDNRSAQKSTAAAAAAAAAAPTANITTITTITLLKPSE